MKSKYTNPRIELNTDCLSKSKIDFWKAEKVIIAGMTKRLEACYSREPLALGVGAYGIYGFASFHPLFLLAILNSRFLTFYLKTEFSDKHLAGGYLAINKSTIEKLPLVGVSASEQQPFIDLADKMLSLNAELTAKRARFCKRLADNLSGVRITGALERFDELEFKQFLAELKKQKITLSLRQQDEWEEYFNENRTACQTLATQITATDHQIDRMAYALYGLTEEEIQIIEKTKTT